MSVKLIEGSSIENKHLNYLPVPNGTIPEPWFRNPSWLPLPNVSVGEDRIVALFSVWDHGANHVALTILGAYTVDWGDGNIENFTSGSTAQHLYDYDNVNISLDTIVPFTFDSTTNTINRTSHGYLNGQWVKVYNVIGTSGVKELEKYYVINKTDNTFQLTKNYVGDGSEVVVDFINDGTGTLLEYKQVIISITPQAGQQLTSINFNVKHTAIPAISPNVNYLDILISVPNASYINLMDSNAGVVLKSLEQFQSISPNAKTSYAYFFYACSSLMSVPVLAMPTGAVTLNMSYMFYYCNSLVDAPMFDTSKATNMTYMFAGCYTLRTVPLYNTSNVTSMYNMFANCLSLLRLPLLNTSNVTNFEYFLYNCNSLIEIDQIDTSKATLVTMMFNGCKSLVSVNNLDFSSVANTTFNAIFQSCTSLKSVKNIKLPNVTSMDSVFSYCYSLEYVSDLDCSKATSFLNIFQNCYSLKKAPYINFIGCTGANGVSSIFNGCIILKDVPVYNLSNVKNAGYMFQNCYSLENIPYLNLPSCTSFTYMFSGCYALKYIEGINSTSALTNINYMFNSCTHIKSIPVFDISGVTSAQYVFTACTSLEEVPFFNTSNITNLTGAFSGCTSLRYCPDLNLSKINILNIAFNSCNLQKIPYFDLSLCNNFTDAFAGNNSIEEIDLIKCNAKNLTSLFSVNSNVMFNLARVYAYGQKLTASYSFNKFRLQDFILTNVKYGMSLAGAQLTKSKLELAMRNLDNVYTAQTLTLTNTLGLDTAITKSCTTSNTSNVVLCTNTSSLSVGMSVTGTGLPQSTDLTGASSSTTNRITLASHGIQNTCPIFIRGWNPTSTAGTLPSSTDWNSICYGNGVYLAMYGYVSNTLKSTIARSTDGINWSNVNLPASRKWGKCFYGNGKFILPCWDNINIVAVSEDYGLTWIEYPMPVTTTPYWYNGKYANGRYVMIGGGSSTSSKLAYSNDGISWNVVSVNSGTYTDLAYGNGRWVAVGNSICIISYDNGETWVIGTTVGSTQKNQLIFTNDMFIAFMANATTYYTSSDGLLWIARTLPNGTWMDAGYTPEGKIILASSLSSTTTVHTSDDGCTWQLLTTGPATYWNACCYGGNNEFVILQGINGNTSNVSNKLKIFHDGFRPNKTYYAINVDTDTFQLSETVNGDPISLDTDSNVVFRTGSKVLSINPNVSIELTSKCVSSATNTLSFRQIDVNPALCKGWSVVY